MKKYLALFLTVALLFGILNGCGKDPAGSGSSLSGGGDGTVSDSDTASSGTITPDQGAITTTTQGTSSSSISGGDSIMNTIAAYEPALSGYKMTAGISDELDMGNKADTSAHGLKTSGSVSTVEITTENGTVKKSYTALKFAGKGAKAEFTLNLSTPKASSKDAPIMLEIMEVHNNNYCAFGYIVQVNGTEVYFRTYEELATGTIHYFIPVPRSLVPDLSKVKVTIVSQDASAFSIGKVWGYNDFYALMEEEDVLTKMGLNLFCKADTTKGAAFVKKFSGLSSFEAAPLYEVDYMNPLTATASSTLSSQSATAANAGTAVQLMLKKYWLFVDGVDGLGGKWSDLKYQQVLYNASTGKYEHTTPNNWSNTHWLSMSNTHLNNVTKIKLSTILTSFADSFNLLAAKGKLPANVDMIMEHGNGYYHQSDFYGGDFSQEVMEIAKARGVALDPTDGLSYDEKRFLYLLIAEMFQMEADTYREAIGYNAVTVRSGKVTLPSYQIISNIWSHGTQTAGQYISMDDRITGWMSGIGSGYWPSSEDMWFDDQRLYEYQLGYGRIGCINLEMAIHGEREALQSFLKQAYRNGMEYVTLFNDKDEYDTLGNVKDIDSLQNQNVDEYHYERSYLDVDYMRDFNTGMIENVKLTPGVVSYNNCRVGATGKLFCDDTNKVGTATYLVSSPTALENGLKVYLEGYTSSGASIEIYGGSSLDSLSKLGDFKYTEELDRFNTCSAFTLDITKKTKGVKAYYIQIRMSNIGAKEANTTLRAIKVTTPWDKETGSTMGVNTTFAQRRMQNLWVAERQAAMRLLEEYKEAGGADGVYTAANKLYEAGRYKSVTKLLTGEISQTLPATYAVQGNGTLGKYPIAVSINNNGVALVELKTVSNDEITFRLASDKNYTLDMTFGALTDGAWYAVKQTATNQYMFYKTKQGTAGAVKAGNGRVTLQVKVTAPTNSSNNLKNTTITGRAYENCTGSEIKLQVQDPAISEYAMYVSFYMTSDCTYTRKKEGSSSTSRKTPLAGDKVTVTLNGDGYVTKVESVYGEVTGTIVKYQKPTVTGTPCNGIITLDNGVSYEIEYSRGSTKFDIGNISGVAGSLSMSRLGNIVKVGQKVTITYSPYTYNNSNRRILTISD